MEDVVSQPAPGIGKVVARMHGSTLGQKALMAVTGILLIGFAFGHMAGHLQMLLGVCMGPNATHEDKALAYNTYAHFLQSLGGIKWAVRFGLLGVTILHVFSAAQVSMRNRAARPIQYEVNKWLAASIGARSMRASGAIVLFFIGYHLLHFTVLAVGTAGFPADDTFKLANGLMVDDVYARMVVSFKQPLLTLIYVGGVGLLSLHLSHGISSSLQTLGLLNSTYRPFVKKVGPALAGLLFAGFASVPLAILAQLVK